MADTVRSLAHVDVLTCPPGTPVAEAAALMAGHKCGSIIVADGGQPLGIWTERDALRLDFDRSGAFDEPISAHMTVPVVTIEGHASLEGAALKLRERGIRHLVVVDDDGSMIGVLSQTDVVLRLGINSYLSFRSVSSVPFRVAFALAHDTDVGEAVRRLDASGSDAALVTEHGEPVGIVTERDIVRLLARRVGSACIGDFATRPLISVSVNATLIEARNILEARRFRHVVVVGNKGETLGILSMSDILASAERGYVRHLEESLDARAKQLAEMERRIELILRAAGEGVVGLDSSGTVTFVNTTALELIGRSETEVLGRNWVGMTCAFPSGGACSSVLCAKEDMDVHREATRHRTCLLKRSDDSEFPVEMSATSLVEGGERVGTVLVFRDITERRRAEDALHASEQRLRLLLDAVGEGIYGLDRDGRCVFVNPAAERMLGWSSRDLIGSKLHGLIHHTRSDGSHYPPEECPVHSTYITGARREVKGEIFWRQDGSCFPVEYLATPIMDGNELTGAVSVFRDVTERLRAQEGLRRERDFTRWVIDSLPGVFFALTSDGRFDLWNRSLEKISGYDAGEIGRMELSALFEHDERDFVTEGVVEAEILLVTKGGKRIPYFFSGRRMPPVDGSKLVGMGVDISQRRVVEEKLRQSNQELEAFAYVASHDLQEPLRVVTGFVQLLNREYKGKLGEDADEYIGFIVDGAHRMQNQIRDLLEFSRVGTQGKTFEGVDLEQVVDEALLNLHPRIEEAQAVLSRDPLPTVMADRQQMIRLFQNLIGNALKYRKPNATPSIRVGARFEGGTWVFFVRDNGIGIASQYFERIFMIFQRLHARDEYEGTGIGLAVCKKIVERHGGKIWLTSEPGEGTTFFFTLNGVE
ncbi:MAG: PAS domain S-box protein [Alphaproteobacteria bacterium]|nr:PAS domain S-box protein [Alphaproteobacteria bacterium]